jgi:hypothetical protein
MEPTITVTLTHTDDGWTWERQGTDKADGRSYRSFRTPSEALYDVYGFELRGDADKPITKG